MTSESRLLIHAIIRGLKGMIGILEALLKEKGEAV